MTTAPPPLLLPIFDPATPAPDEAWRLDLGYGMTLCRQRADAPLYHLNESGGPSIAAAAASCLASERRSLLDGLESGQDPRAVYARHAIRASILAALIALDPVEPL